MMPIVLPWPNPGLSPNSRLHWAQRAKIAKRQRRDAALATEIARTPGKRLEVPQWDGPIHVWITFFPPDRRKRDQDNMLASLKSAFDGIAAALGVDDSRFVLHPAVSDHVYIDGRVEIFLTSGPKP